MPARFVGYTDVQHVKQPEDSELCFASIVSSMTGAEIEDAQAALEGAELSQSDGSTPPMGEVSLHVGGTVLDIKPVQSPFEGAEDPKGALKLIDEQFAEGRAVGLLHKKNGDPNDERHHWTLLTGYCEVDDHKDGPIHIIDPLRSAGEYIGRNNVIEMIKNSMEYAGVYAYAMSTAPAPPAET